ncbi:MAG: hypothetical protein SVJ22_08055 [Halobacteriota archaeon]|nr:hypothetical protein [Halobacteriota archaeon]
MADKVLLSAWEEATGTFRGFDDVDGLISIKIGDKVVKVRVKSYNLSEIQEKLDNIHIGDEIGILCCDDAKNSIRVRKVYKVIKKC